MRHYFLVLSLLLMLQPSAHSQSQNRHPSDRFKPVAPVDSLGSSTKKDYSRPPFNGESKQDRRCHDSSRQLGPPYIQVISVRSFPGNPVQKYRVSGSIEGVCLVEAGYFEEGRIRSRIPVETSSHFVRTEFQILARSDKNPEIRVVNANGVREVLPLDLP